MIVFLFGPDAYRSRRKLAEIVREYRRRGSGDVNQLRVDVSEGSAEEAMERIAAAVKTQSLFPGKRLVVVERTETMAAEDREKLREILERQNVASDDDVVVVVWEEGRGGGDALGKLLSSRARSQEFLILKGRELEAWVREEAANLDVPLTGDGLTALAGAVGGDLRRMREELCKLRDAAESRHAKEEERRVDASLVASLVSASIESTIFQLIDAIGQRNRRAAMEFLREQLGKGEDPLKVLGMVSYGIRTLLQVKDLVEQGVPFRELAQRSGLSAFVAKKAYEQSQLFSFEELRTAHRLLFELDTAIKTGAMAPESALEQFVLGL